MSQQQAPVQEEQLQPLTVKLEENLINASIHYMRTKSKAWSNPTKAFTHLVTVFMGENWLSGNTIANKANGFFKEAPFTAEEVKRYCEEFTALGVFHRKEKAGKVKYKITRLGYSMLVEDKVMLSLFKMFEQQQQGQNGGTIPNPAPQQTPPVSTDLIVNYETDSAPTDKPSEPTPEKANQDTDKEPS